MKSTNPIASLFGSSPFKPLQEHMRIVNECVAEVPALFESLIAGDAAGVEKIRDQIFAKEQAADQMKNQLRAHLPKSLFMPVDRRDLLEVLDMQDSIADTAQDIAGLLTERDMSVPAEMVDDLRSLVQRCVDTCQASASIVGEIDELIETGFRGREAAKVEDMVEKLGKIEDETDELGISLARTLFKHEESMSPVSVIFWYQLIEWIGDLADYAEKVGDRLRLLIAR
jgi:predicted phosphate transport protein (TIGR00153 family)